MFKKQWGGLWIQLGELNLRKLLLYLLKTTPPPKCAYENDTGILWRIDYTSHFIISLQTQQKFKVNSLTLYYYHV